jgi:Bacillus phage endonuclease
MTDKTCKVCKLEKPACEFYSRGLECKLCTRIRVAAYARKNSEYIRIYRASKQSIRIRNDPYDKELAKARSARYYLGNKHKVSVRDKLHKAIKRGAVIKPEMCSRCRTVTEVLDAHHADYGKPLEVTWLCDTCHGAEHVKVAVPEHFEPRKTKWKSAA